jgi:quinohemoprotein ethanol dehydrogenase
VKLRVLDILLGAALSLAGVAAEAQSIDTQAIGSVIDNAALNDDADGRNWPAFGRTFGETHYSPLRDIDTATVARLGLAWSLDLDVTNSITAPLAVDGVIYLGAGHGIVQAVAAQSGEVLWRYDAQAMQQNPAKLRTAWGIHGIAFWQGKVYAGTSDGRLIALDAKSGALVWSVQTVDPENGATINGPPRAFNGKIIIGFAGADFSPLRGYVSAYDAETGQQVWRFYTVPGQEGIVDGAASDSVMDLARATWDGEWWKYGGGGAVWHAITYDPDFNRLYIGTGNGLPMNWKLRSPGGGDNLFIASIVALEADTGRYVWHYQVTPGDSWDYDATSDLSLATLRIEGQDHKVIVHADKNGFIYLLDRADGKLLAADKLGTVTWAERVDLTTGRPVLAPGARYENNSIRLWPSVQAVHPWLPQSYSPRTGYVYIPTLEMSSVFGDSGVDRENFSPRLQTGDFTGMGVRSGEVPDNPGAKPVEAGYSILRAWDPLARRTVWQIETPGISNGGTLATAGDLVFQGLADGYFHAYSAQDGKDLWSFFAGVAATGVPITYSAGGKQYVTITAGPPGGSTAGGALAAQFGWDPRIHPRRLLTFVLDGQTALPPTPPRQQAQPLDAPEFQVDATKAQRGAREYSRCTLCHGPGAVAGGAAPDLRASAVLLSFPATAQVLRDGSLSTRGMPPFPELSDTQLEDIQHYIRQKARADLSAAAAR